MFPFFFFGKYSRELYHVFDAVLSEILSSVNAIGAGEREHLCLKITTKTLDCLAQKHTCVTSTTIAYFSRDDGLHGEYLRGFVVLQDFSWQHMTDARVEPHQFALKHKTTSWKIKKKKKIRKTAFYDDPRSVYVVYYT